MKKNKVFIHLMGREYALLTDQDVAQVQRLARYVDRKMREVSITTRAGEGMVPMLTAMTLAGELFSAQDENVRLKREIASLKSEQKAE
ncbi:MAG: cell division protein ZapA [Clostridiales bacterium]|nr:cell division protein ZapA [Clostridiales bacterium]